LKVQGEVGFEKKFKITVNVNRPIFENAVQAGDVFDFSGGFAMKVRRPEPNNPWRVLGRA
jgi:hypothetical protein